MLQPLANEALLEADCFFKTSRAIHGCAGFQVIPFAELADQTASMGSEQVMLLNSIAAVELEFIL
jgi:hypothetical protein